MSMISKWMENNEWNVIDAVKTVVQQNTMLISKYHKRKPYLKMRYHTPDAFNLQHWRLWLLMMLSNVKH